MRRVPLLHRVKTPLERNNRAQGLLEFALVLPVFLWITVGIVDFGRGIATYSVISNAAHEGARAGIFPVSSTDTQDSANATINAAVNAVTFFLGNIPDSPSGTDPGTGTYMVVSASSTLPVPPTPPDWSPSTGQPPQPSLQTERTSGNWITVTVHYRFYPITPLISSVVGSSINLSATSTMPIE